MPICPSLSAGCCIAWPRSTRSVRAAYAEFDFKKAYRLLADFCSNDLSAIYFDIRKDTLYCEA